jgi:hypothetical protein
VASIGKRCKHTDQTRCRCNWVVRYRDAQSRQREESFLWDQKTLANDRKLKIERDLRAGTVVFGRHASGEKLDTFARTWLAQHTGSASTVRNYRSCYDKHIKPALGHLALSAVDRASVRRLLLETMPKTVGTAMTVTARSVLVSMLAEAERQHKIPENPARAIRLPKGDSERAEFTYASAEQLADVEHALSAHWRVALWLMRGCGLRIGEALAVKSTSVRGDMLRVEEQVLGSGERGPLKHRKPGEYWDVPIPAYVAEKIAAHIAQYGPGYLAPEFAAGERRPDAWRNQFMAGKQSSPTPKVAKRAGQQDVIRRSLDAGAALVAALRRLISDGCDDDLWWPDARL